MAIYKEIDLLIHAKQSGYAIAAFNVENYEMAKAVIDECNELKSPVIIAASTNTLKYISPGVFVKMVTEIVDNSDIPVSIHLDHAKTINDVTNAIKCGFNSVMYDGSQLPYLDNVENTKECYDICALFGVSLEGELGAIAGKKDENKYFLTEPYMAVDFVSKTKVNSLAVAIGTCHGVYKQKPCLDYQRLQQISSSIQEPIVLHGASGLSQEQIQICIKNGVSKINFATDIRVAYTSSIRQYLLQNPEIYDPKQFGIVGIESVRKKVRDILHIVGSVGKSNEIK